MSALQVTQLPAEFSELNEFVEQWSKAEMAEQYASRLNSSIPEMQPFYEAVKARVQDIRDYLDQIAFEDYTEADAALGHLLIGWVPVAEAIEVFKQTRVPDSKGYWEFVQEPHDF